MPASLAQSGGTSQPDVLEVDCGAPSGPLRRLNGVNKGPLVAGGLMDIDAAYRRLDVPLVRLHDCRWPSPDVVDMNVVFPNPTADPDDPRSYDFSATDPYLRAIADTGAGICYRLGQSIEHAEPRRFVHPPADPERWARACIGVVRHCNEGWAGGMRLGIRHWEIWNEPDVRPQMWTGTDDEFGRLYVTASRAIKARFPNIEVGGPALASPGEPREEGFKPSTFAKVFLDACRRERAPLDFLSWHIYASDPHVVPPRAHGVRAMLDAAGFNRTRSHLNEWNYIPGGDWGPVMRGGAPTARRAFYQRMAGQEGAAFVAAVLMLLQDTPLDECCFYHAETSWFGIFDPYGVPQPVYYALLAFRELLRSPTRAAARWRAQSPVVACAGTDGDGGRARVLLSLPADEPRTVRLQFAGLPWSGAGTWAAHAVEGERGLVGTGGGRLEGGAVTVEVAARGVVLVEFGPEVGNPKRFAV